MRRCIRGARVMTYAAVFRNDRNYAVMIEGGKKSVNRQLALIRGPVSLGNDCVDKATVFAVFIRV